MVSVLPFPPEFAPFPPALRAETLAESQVLRESWLGSTGSDLLLIQQGKQGAVNAISSDNKTRSIIPDSRPITRIVNIVGDRLGDGNIICGKGEWKHKFSFERTTRMVITTGSGESKLLGERIFPGTISWMQELMAYGTASVPSASVSPRLLLFDIERGKIEPVSSLSSLRRSDMEPHPVIMQLQPKVAIFGTRETFAYADMRIADAFHTLSADWGNGFLASGGSTLAGCCAFFSGDVKHQVGLFRYEALCCLPAPPPISFIPLQAGQTGGTWGVIPRVSSSVEVIFSWQASREQLVAILHDDARYNTMGRTIVIANTRRHQYVTLPSASKRFAVPYVRGNSLQVDHVFAPTFVAGMPGILAISPCASTASFMIV